MARRSVVVTRELPLDHQRRCEHCGNAFTVYYRAYASGKSSTKVGANFFSHVVSGTPLGASDRANYDSLVAAFDVLKENAHLRHFQRCTHCGKYDNASLEWMRQSYGAYRHMCFFQVGVVGVLCLLTPLLSLLERDANDKGAMFLLLTPAAALFLVAYWLLKRPMPPLRFQQQVDQANSSDRPQRWLRRWNAKTPALLKTLHTAQDMQMRNKLWLTLVGHQEYLEPKHGLTQGTEPLPPMHECVNALDQRAVGPDWIEEAPDAMQQATEMP